MQSKQGEIIHENKKKKQQWKRKLKKKWDLDANGK